MSTKKSAQSKAKKAKPAMDPQDVQIGARVQAARKRMGMTQQELAVATGLHSQTISNYERGEPITDTHALMKISSALGQSVGHILFGGEEEDVPWPSILIEFFKTAEGAALTPLQRRALVELTRDVELDMARLKGALFLLFGPSAEPKK